MMAPGIVSQSNGAAPSLNEIVEAVKLILDPTSSATKRASANALCERVKSLPEATEIAFALLTVEMPLSARMYGLNILDNWIRTRPMVQDAVAMRDRIWALLGLVVNVRAEERRLMQDKTALLIAQVALRIWPQYWPDFFERLIELVTKEGGDLEADPNAVLRTEMGLLMARTVVDEIHPREAQQRKELVLDDARRPELQKALGAVLPVMLSRVYALLPHSSQWSDVQMRALQPLLESMIEAYASMHWWCPIEKERTIGCILAILRITAISEPLGQTALEALAHVAARPPRGSPGEQDIVGELFDAIVEPVRDLLGRFAAMGLDGYDQFKKLADFIVTLTTTNMSFKKQPCVPNRLDALLDLMLQLSSFPSLLVTSNVGGVWATVVKSERLVKHPAFVARLSSVFLLILLSLAQDGKAQRKRDPYNTEDFSLDDKEADVDFSMLFETSRNRNMELLRLMSLHHPATMVDFITNALGTFLNERGTLTTIDSAALPQWDALCHVTDCILKPCLNRLISYLSLPAVESSGSIVTMTAAEREKDQQDRAEGQRLLEHVNRLASIVADVNIWNHTRVHPEIFYVWFVVLRTLVSILGTIKSPHYSALLQFLFEVTFSYEIPLSLVLPNGSTASGPIGPGISRINSEYDRPEKIDSMRHAVRCRAGTSILKACQFQPDLFIPAIDYMVSLLRNTLSSTDKSRERQLMTEMLLNVALAHSDASGRTSLLEVILGSVLQSQSNINNTIGVASGDLSGNGYGSLINASGLGYLLGTGPSTETDENILFRRVMSQHNSLLYVVLSLIKKYINSQQNSSLACSNNGGNNGQQQQQTMGIKNIDPIIFQFVSQLAPSLATMITMLHKVFNKTSFGGLVFDQWQKIFGDSIDDVAVNVSGQLDELPATEKLLDADALLESMEQVPGRSLKGWFVMLRISSYMNYGQLYLLAPMDMYSPAILSTHLEAILPGDSADTFSMTQTTLITKHLIAPLLLGITSDLFRDGASHFMEPLKRVILLMIEKFGCVKLEAGWQQFKAAQEVTNTGHNHAALTVESAYETLLTTATQSLLSTLYDILLPIGERDKKADPSLDIAALLDRSRLTADFPCQSSLSIWIMTEGGMASKVLLFLTATLRWRPQSCMSRTIAIISRWLPTWMISRPELHETLFGTLLSLLLAALSNSALGDQHPSLIAIITEYVKWSFFFDYDILISHLTPLLGADVAINTVSELRRAWLSQPQPNLKNQRLLVKNGLIRLLQQQALSSVGVTTVIPRLPDRLVILRKVRAQQDTDDFPDVAGLFD